MSSRREEAVRALESRDWSGGEVVTEPAEARVVLSAEVPAELAAWVGAEADRRGINPGDVIRDALVTVRASPAAE
jgi:hypothetical protein